MYLSKHTPWLACWKFKKHLSRRMMCLLPSTIMNNLNYKHVPFITFKAGYMIGKDSTGMELYLASIVASSGAHKMSFDRNFAVSIPPRFLLYQVSRHVNLCRRNKKCRNINFHMNLILMYTSLRSPVIPSCAFRKPEGPRSISSMSRDWRPLESNLPSNVPNLLNRCIVGHIKKMDKDENQHPYLLL